MSPAERLAALRAELARLGVDGVLIPRADEHLGEYVPPSGERLAWLTGFTGSAGLAVVLPDRAALFTDGRYTTQAAQQTDTALWEQRHITENPPGDWLAEHAAGQRIGYDPWLHSEAGLQRLERPGVSFVPLPRNPVDAIWADRPAPPAAPALPHTLEFAGKSAAEKREEAAAALRAAGEDAAVLADAHSLAWLLNLRGGDLENTPLALGFTLLRADASAEIYMDPGKVPPETRAHLGNDVVVRPRGEIAAALKGLAGRKVRLDPEATPAWFGAALREAGARVVAGDDPVRLPRACKNAVEQQGARAAHGRDAVALARFLAWFAKAAPAGGQTELSAAETLLGFRRDLALFHGESFPAISGAGEHGAIVHYRVTPESDRRINPDECYLIDSGGQFRDGTTDVTRTLWSGPGPAPALLKERYTRVLQGHLALAALRFPKGVAGPHLDAIARRALWAVGLDYDHGTGHGVGSFLSVHEGPVAFSRAAKPVPLAPGMILSDEPGYYLPGHYGIRIENLLLVREAPAQPDQVKPFLEFETLTLAPYERALIAVELLTREERAQVDAYHARVLAEVGPHCDAETAAWLQGACAPLS
ncbi:aminopeptidase P family protein [Siccirubricoccus sp. KC 17139]|uniref:Aminopeptidase P family protein n=1 Tax=Siccirubricoccus soli TaxID=2899147 RepID=A0ABT1DCH2_9PROT|nr:aminopeptidase P family protein [Siccirubricoccus soli]MCO6418635.1 aminopeptidase P family protein [Siccirubricoccus soli]MCP2684770.1 aminopeptidase P family protein [Siccirubricoccus soli]